MGRTGHNRNRARKTRVAALDVFRERGTLPVGALLAEASASPQPDPLATLKNLALMALTQLALHPDTQAMFDVIVRKCEFTAGQLPPDTDTFLATRGMHAFMVGLMHEWVKQPASYSLADHAEALLDCYLTGLATRPPRRPGTPEAQPSAGVALRRCALSAKRRAGAGQIRTPTG